MNEILVFRSVWKRYYGDYVLRNVSLVIQRNEFVCIRGRSGVGKSTLAKLAALIMKPDKGDVFFLNKNVGRLSDYRRSILRLKYIGYIPQSFDLIEEYTVLENIIVPMVFAGMPRSMRVKRAKELLKRVGLEGYDDRMPRELSGGERQRVAIARALANNPLLVVADEPLSNLDQKTIKYIIDLFLELARNGRSVLMTTTDLYSSYPCTKDYMLENGLLNELKSGIGIGKEGHIT